MADKHRVAYNPNHEAMLRFHECMEIAIQHMHQTRQFESVCQFNEFIKDLEATTEPNDFAIAAKAIAYFGKFTLFFGTAIYGMVMFLDQSPHFNASAYDTELIKLIYQLRDKSPQKSEKSLRQFHEQRQKTGLWRNGRNQ